MVHTALRVGRSLLKWILANGKSPPVLPTAEKPLLNLDASERRENAAWERARLGAPGVGRVRRSTFSASC